MTIVNGRRRQVTTVAAAFLAGSAVAAATTRARRDKPDGAVSPLELTASHRAGTGTPLLLLHGITAFWHVWSPVLPYLEAHHDVVAPTLLGHAGGLPLDAQVAPSVDALADGIEADLDRLGLTRVHIAGNSLGGWLGIELARRRRARSLVLFSPAGAWQSQRRIALRAAAIRRSAGVLGRYASRADTIASSPTLRWLLLASQVAHPDRVAPDMVAATIRASAAAPVVAPLARVLPRSQVQPLPETRDYPVRVVWGDRDRVLPFKHFGAPMLARIPGAESVRLPGVGHVPMFDDPAGVARLILEVTSGVDRAVAANA